MQSLLQKFDRLAGLETENNLAKWFERIAFFFLILMVLAEPHSIAATQIAWLAGMFVWALRQVFIRPRPKLVKTPLDAALWAFFGWTVLTAFTSYAPDISADRLRNAALFLIFYFIINVVRTKRAAIFLVFALIFSSMFVAVWTPIERLIGRGVEVSDLKPESPLAKGGLLNSDTILEANKKKIRTPEDLINVLEQNDATRLTGYRPDYNFEIEVKRADLLTGASAVEKLGIGSWKHSRNWRSAGFYSHFTTFADVLQMIASLAFGLFIALINYKFSSQSRRGATGENQSPLSALKSKIFEPRIFLLAACLAAMSLALLLTVTRASQAAFLLSALTIVLISGNRRMVAGLAAVVLPLAIAGVFLLQYSRPSNVVSVTDESAKYRLMMYRDGFRLWTDSPRNFIFGVGMDSIKRYWREWDLFDKGWQPMSHFHSTPLQLVVERGLPALILWLWGIWIYARLLWRNLKSKIQNPKSNDWRETGILLGAFGGLVGFFASSLVHYNFGAAIIAMLFFIIMGLSVKLVVNGEE